MTSSHMYASVPQDCSSAEARLVAVDIKDVEYEVTYFQISCVGTTPRYLLSYGKTNWKNHHPKNFFDPESTERYEHPFGCLPTLKIRSTEGEGEILLAEAFNIDLFLAKKFNLLGENEIEELAIRTFYSQIHYLRERSLMRMTWTFPEKRPEAWEEFTTKTLPGFIQMHEQHLERNGFNGHYVGDKLTLADIHLMSVIDHFAEIPRGEELVEFFKASPLIWKVCETARENPEIAAWRNTDEFKKLVEGGKALYSVTAFVDKKQE
ncbi:Glutathione S-transferase S1 [Mortierella sp. GBA30]|nr:Glutathione S-transferase S1 [Mortierella sp. GBA30]